MEKSNIIGGSNVYPCKDNPLSEQEFVNQIEDYDYIKTIYKMREFRQLDVHLTRKQSQLLEIEMRCSYAKHDPCWGYINGKGIRCRCVEGRCPRILECNPTYNIEQQEYWTMTDTIKTMYGYPDKQKKYYLVDLISDEEMARYISEPRGAGIEFPPLPEPESKVLKTDKPMERKLVIIGYEDIYFGDADNQLSPIWGYVDDPEDVGPIITYRYGKSKKFVHENAHKVDKIIQKENSEKKLVRTVGIKYTVKEKSQQTVTGGMPDEKILQYEERVKNKLGVSYQLTEITEKLISEISYGRMLNIILSNEAEMAYVSSMLLQANVTHGMENCEGNKRVCLWKAQTKKSGFLSGIIMVSNTFVHCGCSMETKTMWSKLGDASEIKELVVSGREFFNFVVNKKQQRWGCKNLYGATHIAIRMEDLNILAVAEKEQKISLVRAAKNYTILSKTDAKQIGVTTDKLWEVLESLKKSNEIPELPREIVGLVLSKVSDGFEIRGIGHMKFDEY